MTRRCDAYISHDPGAGTWTVMILTAHGMWTVRGVYYTREEARWVLRERNRVLREAIAACGTVRR